MLRNNMNLLEFLDMLKQKDQDEVWQKVLFGGSIRTLKTFEVSTEGSDEDIINQIAAGMGRSIEEVRKALPLEKLAKTKTELREIEQVTKEYREYLKINNATKGKYEELRDLGSLLVALKSEMAIQIPSKVMDYPDFVIGNLEKKIGLEHTRLLDRSSKENVEFIRKLFKRAEQILLQEFPEAHGLINVELDYGKAVIDEKNIESGKFTSADKETISQEIAHYIKNLINGGAVTKPCYILSARVIPHQSSPLTIKHSENFVGKSNFEEMLHNTMKPKEDRFKQYSQVDTFDEVWLLISIQSLSTSASYNLDDIQRLEVMSQFDQVILFDLVAREPIFLKIKRPT